MEWYCSTSQCGNGHEEGAFDWRIPVGYNKEEWEQICNAPPFHPLPYPPKPMKKEQRVHGVLSFCKGRSARLARIDDYIMRQWLSQLLAFPLARRDDAVNSTVTGIERLAGFSDFEVAAGTHILDLAHFNEE